MLILMVPAVMLNASSYIISRYQTEHLFLNKIKGAPSDNASLCNQGHLPRHPAPNWRYAAVLILCPPATLNKESCRFISLRLKEKLQLRLKPFSFNRRLLAFEL
jgi:hypothetical protein